MKNKKYGFTLIELLAVIIILAIVALIATPIILNVIEDARISAGKSEANMILNGINNYCATEDVKAQMDEDYVRICTSGLDAEKVKEMVNLGNATIESIRYNGSKLTELVIESNNHTFTLCPSGTFAMDDEECDAVAVITTGPIKDVVLSNFPYLETNGNGCVTPTANNYSYMGGCYLKGGSQSGKDIFLDAVFEPYQIYTIWHLFFDENANFIEENFENWFKDFASQQGMTEDDINQMLQEAGVSTFFEFVMIDIMGKSMTPDEVFIDFESKMSFVEFILDTQSINKSKIKKTMEETFFNSEGNFMIENFENWFNEFASQQGMTEDEINQLLQYYGVDTIFEYIIQYKIGKPMTPEELFAMQSLNKFLWYSGYLWRIMGINADGTVRLITDDSVTEMPYDNDSSNWENSDIKQWLNNNFYNQLEKNDIIVNQSFCSEMYNNSWYGETASRVSCNLQSLNQPTKIGLLTIDEYNLSGGTNSYLFFGFENWSMTPYNDNEIFVVSYEDYRFNNYHYYVYDNKAVRPVINIKEDVIIVSGSGAENDAYKIN